MHFLAVVASALILQGISVRCDPVAKCAPRNATYHIADDKQCDKYHECLKNGEGKMTERMCRDGFVFSDLIEQCDLPFKVECGQRTELQPSQSTNPLCARLNGLYAFNPKESCAKFYHCQEGVAYEKECPYTSIYDPTIGTCVHPGAVNRPECSASQVFNFQCPNLGKKFAKLRFYDHDRVKHPEDCRKYFACFTDGQPRLYGCPYGKVFYEKLGRCIAYAKHPDPECNVYYKKGGKGYHVEQDEEVGDESIEHEEGSEEQPDQADKPVKKAKINQGSKSKSQSPLVVLPDF